jgi:hypothetical protein
MSQIPANGYRTSGRRSGAMQSVTVLLLSLEGLLSLVTCYLLTLLLAAAVGRRARPPSVGSADRLRVLVLVPAHNEELSIASTLASLRCIEYPKDRFEIIVVADNCEDATADLARAAGATVYERTDPSRRGKGHALAWALERLRTDRPDAEAVAFVDADCRVSPNFLTAIESRLRAGAVAVQTNNVVANPHESWSSALRFAAFTLIGTIRPLGKDTLGLSSGLRGTGMGFTRALLERHPWEAFSLAEDGEYHLRLVAAGERVVFAPEASVRSAMPTSLQQARQQHLRWEGGKWEIVRAWTPRLVQAGLRHRSLGHLHAGLEPLVPPQSLHLAGMVALASLAAVLRSRAGVRIAAANLLGQACYVIGGLLLVRAPAGVYRALALAPVLVAWKVGLYATVIAGRSPKSWVRTGREPTAARPDRATVRTAPERWPHLSRQNEPHREQNCP